jgi:beta-galactosidase
MSKRNLILTLLTAAVCCWSARANAATEATLPGSRTRDLGWDWKFIKGDPANAQPVDFDDSGWSNIDLPHDWTIAEPKDRKTPGGQQIGFFPTGIGWYRKHFQISKADEGKQICVQFDGVYQNSEVWINGHRLGKRPYGYSSFEYELTPHVRFGGDNVLAVRVDNSKQPNSRWYTGSGIYRLVRLTVTDKLHVKQWGTEVTTPRISTDEATVRVRTEVQNSHDQQRDCTLVTRIVDSKDKVVAEQIVTQAIGTQGDHRFDQEVTVPKPKLWSIQSRNLYRVRTFVRSGKELCDEYETPFGIHEVRFDKDQGFLLNGEPVKLKGVNLHHDAGSLGAAVPVRAWERRLEILKSIGCNAIRTSHNPPAPELLDLCDRMGFVVIDEAFDKWDGNYARSFADWGKVDLADMVRRDRNHPSIVLWSVGNELNNQGSPDFMETLKQLVAVARETDPTRPVTVALKPFKATSHAENAKRVMAIARLVDVISCNYQEQWFEDYRKEFPEVIIIASESYPYYRGKDLDYKAFHPVNPWLDAEAHGYVAGTFYWAGIDYLGEAEAGWPFHGWNGSLIDTCGYVRPVGELVKSFWVTEPMVHIAVMDDSLDTLKPTKDHWGWPKMVSHWNLPPQLAGKKVKVATFSNCDAVELLINGRSAGVKNLADFPDKMITWEVPHEAGRIEARGIKRGRVKAKHELETAGEAARIRVAADRKRIHADGRDLCYVDVEITDKQGRLVPSALHEIWFSVEGAGKIVGVDNGDLTSKESYKASQREAYYGRAQVVIQATRTPGEIVLSAETDGLSAAKIEIDSR